MNSLRKNLGFVYFILPYIHIIENKFSLIFSILSGSSNYTLKLKDDIVIKFHSSKFSRMMSLLGILSYSTSFSKNNDKIEFSFDMKNKFTLPIYDLSYEDQNMLELLYGSIKYGANFVTEKNIDLKNYRDKTFRIFSSDGKKIIETSNGIKFFIDAIHPGNTIIETFVRNIHLINSADDFNGKVVIDVGAECGDTPLYFASLGAKVYAFEPIPEHYNDMIRNISLNPKLSDKIIPINAGIGKNGKLAFFQNADGEVGSTSFVENVHGENAKITHVTGYSLESALKEFNIPHVDLLKMDCKGCEFFLTEDALKNVDRVKIEFSQFADYHLEDLLKLLEKSGFECMTYQHEPTHHVSSLVETNIYGTKTY
jgi:FkbM family methyltransferase